MAQLAQLGITDIQQAMRERRPAMVVGPARSGVTSLVNQIAAAAFDPVARINLRAIHDLDHLRTCVGRALKLEAAPQDPSDVQIALAAASEGDRPRLVVANDCHRTSPECRSWLLQSILASATGGGQTAVPVLLEGAFDPDASLTEALPDGYSAYPLIHYVEPSTPWRMLTEVEELVRARWRQSFTPGLVPWIADVSGGDVGFVQELLERLPNEGDLHEDTLQAAVRYVIAKGMRSREIRESVRDINDPELMRSIASGRGISGVVPSTMDSCALKKAYFAGIVVFDGISWTYRVRGPITASIVSQAIGTNPDDLVFAGRFMLARLLIFFAHIAAFELDLRALLRTHHPASLAKAVMVETGLSVYRKKVRDAIVQHAELPREALGRMSDAVKSALPESTSLWDLLRDRLGVDPTDDGVLEGATLTQMTQLARAAELLNQEQERVFLEIGVHRNAFAHFRAQTYANCVDLLRKIASARHAMR